MERTDRGLPNMGSARGATPGSFLPLFTPPLTAHASVLHGAAREGHGAEGAEGGRGAAKGMAAEGMSEGRHAYGQVGEALVGVDELEEV